MRRTASQVTAAAVLLCCLSWPVGAQQEAPSAPEKPADSQDSKGGSAPPITEQPVDKFTPFSSGKEVSKDFPVSFPTDI